VTAIIIQKAMTQVIRWGWSRDPGPTAAGSYLAIFNLGRGNMKELSVFIDESGDFGLYEPHSAFYIVTLIFHDQSVDISGNIKSEKNENPSATVKWAN
jgi:hypothetical protein